MNLLDLPKLHDGLQLEYGVDAAYISDVSTTSSTYLLAPSGLPLFVGWFDNSRHYPGARSKGNYALTTYPEEPKHMLHRLMILQDLGDSGGRLVEEDSAACLDDCAGPATLLRRQAVEQPILDWSVRAFALGAHVLNSATGKDHEMFGWRNRDDVAAVREHGLAIIAAGDVLASLDAATLDTYAAIDPPVVH